MEEKEMEEKVFKIIEEEFKKLEKKEMIIWKLIKIK